MYTQAQKKFRPKKQQDIEWELQQVVSRANQAGLPLFQRIFLADGDAMTLSFNRLQQILIAINKYLPDINRVSAYCLPRNLLNKSVDELIRLRELGLSLVYVGCESGDDQVLQAIDKGETYQSSLVALHKLKQAGIKASVMILNGMGGKVLSRQHAIQSARLMNDTQPEYLATLVVSYPLGDQRVKAGYEKMDLDYQLPDTYVLIEELHTLLSHLELEKTIFRSDHASNYLVLKGVLNKDKSKLLATVEKALKQPGSVPLRREWQRGL